MNTPSCVLTRGLVLLGLMIALGCARETESGVGLSGSGNSKQEEQRSQTLDAKLRHFKRGLESEEGWPITFGGQLLEEIVGMSNAQILHDRMNRPRPASCRSPTEDDVPVSSGL